MGFCRCTLSFLATLYLWLMFWISHILTLIVQLIFALLFCWVYLCSRPTYFKILALVHYVGIFPLITLNPFWWVKRVKDTGEGKLILPKGSLIMSNHLSYVDSFILASKTFPKTLTFVAMEKVFKVPILGQVLKLGGHIPVEFYRDEENKLKVNNREKLIERSKLSLQNGRRLVIFPEGKLSKTGELNPFKIGFFKTAVDTNSPILPTAMWGCHTLFPPGDQYAAAHPGVVEIKFGTLIQPAENESAEELRDRVREAIEKLLSEIPSWQNWKRKQEENSIKVQA